MMLNDLVKTTGDWLQGTGEMADVVISSRIRLARNLADRPFTSTANATEKTEIYRLLSDCTAELPTMNGAIHVDIDEAEKLDREVLVERHLISTQHARGKGSRGVTVASDESAAVMINEEDHLRIQTLAGGLQLDKLWHQVNQIDDDLSERVAFAFDPKLGYLTACPTNVGTGLRVSVMVHMPALHWTKDIERVERAARDMRLAVRGLYGEGTEAVGDLYQISNQTTLGPSEEEIIQAFSEKVIPEIVDYEYAARQALLRDSKQQLDDRAWRAYGILSHARCISSQETLALLSPIRMSIHMGRFDVFDLETLNELFLFTQSSHLQKMVGKRLEGTERAVARANFIRDRLNQ